MKTKGLTAKNVKDVLKSPSTHNLVHDVLALCKRQDPIDALYDLEFCVEAMKTVLRDNYAFEFVKS